MSARLRLEAHQDHNDPRRPAMTQQTHLRRSAYDRYAQPTLAAWACGSHPAPPA